MNSNQGARTVMKAGTIQGHRFRWVTITTILACICAHHALAQQSFGRRPRPNDKTNGFKDNPKMLAAFHDVVASPSRSVVRIQCDGKDVALGTIVAADGWIITKSSQLSADAAPSVIFKDGRTLPAKVVGADQKYDLAMLKVQATDLVPVRWGASKSATVGELLASPGTGNEPVAVGVLSVAARSVRTREFPPSQPPANSGFLGVSLEEAEGGARIVTIMADSAAAKAGLKVNDIVTFIVDTPIIDSETMVNTIQHHKPGDTVPIKVKRGENELEVKATLEKRPPEPGLARRDNQNRMGSELSNRRDGFPQILQHDMVIKPNDCGGPVVDLDGNAIGINIARAGRVESYAIPAEAVQKLIESLKSGKLAIAATAPTTRPATTMRAK